MTEERNRDTVEVKNVLGEIVEIKDTPLKDLFNNEQFLGSSNPIAKDFFTDELIKKLEKM